MFCVNCGKSLIRGYQFCIECGTPVEEMPEEENEANGEAAGSLPEMPSGTGPDEDGSLVFCPNCGMHMQTSTAFCEMCGMRLSGGQESAPQQAAKPAVPMWNDNSLGDELSGMTDSNINSINNFVNGISDFVAPDGETAEAPDIQEDIGGVFDAGYPNFQSDYSAFEGSAGFDDAADTSIATPDGIDALTEQIAQYSASTGVIPTASTPTQQSVSGMQKEIETGEGILMQNFSMEAADDEEISVNNAVPIITGGSMDEDLNDITPINPYKFLDNDFGDISSPFADNSGTYAESAADFVESIMPGIGSIAPANQNDAPTIEDIVAPVEDDAPYQSRSAVPLFDSAAAYEGNMSAAHIINPDISADSANQYAPEFEMPVLKATDTEESIYAQDHIIEKPVEETASENNAPTYVEVPAYPFFEKNAASSKPNKEESAALSENGGLIQPNDEFEDYAEPYISEGLPVIAECNGYNEGENEKLPFPSQIPNAENISSPAELLLTAEYSDDGASELKRPGDSARKITYCHNCGQNMYEDEQFCKNCNAPRNISLVPVSQKKSKKLVPIIAAAAVVVAVAAVILFVQNGRSAGNVTESETLSVSDPVGEPVNSAADPADTSEKSAEVSEIDSEIKLGTEENIFPPSAVTSSDIETEKIPESVKTTKPANSSTTPKSSAAAPKPSSAPNSAAASKSAASTAPKPATTSTAPKPAVTSVVSATPTTPTTLAATSAQPKPSGSSAISSPEVTSLENDRKAITDAVAVIAGEVGKIEALAQNVVYAMENSANGESARTAFYSRDFAKNMLSSIDSGKTAVDKAVSAASPKNGEFDGAYDNLMVLQGKYEAYYKFIKSPSGNTSKFSSSCGTYLSGVTSYINSNFKYSSLIVSAYTSNDKTLAYKAIMSDAVTAANSAINAFDSVEGSISELESSNFDTAVVKELSKISVSRNYANAAANAQKVAGYVMMLSGAPSEYSSAYNSLKSASSELISLVDLLIMIQENTPENYSESSSDGISAAKSAINKVKDAVS